MKLSVTISGIGSRMRNFGEDRVIARMRTAIGNRTSRRPPVGDEEALQVAGDADNEANSFQPMR